MKAINQLIEMDRVQPKRIFVVGDGMVDIYVHGREGPCQEGCTKFVEDSRVTVPGGAANAARSLENWSARCVLFTSVLGPVKMRFMSGDRCVFRYDDDSNCFDLALVRDEALRALEAQRPDAVLLSDYDKGLLTPKCIQQVVGECKKRKIPVVADAKREPKLYGGAILKCNEAYRKSYQSVMPNQSGKLIITYGERSPTTWDGPFCTSGYNCTGESPVECVNHVGAGDCFAAHLTLALAYGLTLIQATAIAHSAGRVYVQFPHNRPPYPSEIRDDIISTTT